MTSVIPVVLLLIGLGAPQPGAATQSPARPDDDLVIKVTVVSKVVTVTEKTDRRVKVVPHKPGDRQKKDEEIQHDSGRKWHPVSVFHRVVTTPLKKLFTS